MYYLIFSFILLFLTSKQRPLPLNSLFYQIIFGFATVGGLKFSCFALFEFIFKLGLFFRQHLISRKALFNWKINCFAEPAPRSGATP